MKGLTGIFTKYSENYREIFVVDTFKWYLYLGECLQTEMRSSPAAGRRVPAAPRDEY